MSELDDWKNGSALGTYTIESYGDERIDTPQEIALDDVQPFRQDGQTIKCTCCGSVVKAKDGRMIRLGIVYIGLCNDCACDLRDLI